MEGIPRDYSDTIHDGISVLDGSSESYRRIVEEAEKKDNDETIKSEEEHGILQTEE